MSFNYLTLLTEKNILAISKKYGFIDESYLEKFIMDFEMHHRIVKQIDGCITRGGLCMPFHTPTIEAKRLSIDIDLLTYKTVDEVKDIMDNINNTMTDIKCEKIVPMKPYPIDNLISYYVEYKSCLTDKDRIKIDFLCNVNIQICSEIIKSGFELFDFSTKHDIKILSKGSLLGDKLTTMALGTIGLKLTKQTEIAKQIYDIGILLNVSKKPDLHISFDTFKSLTDFKISHFNHVPKYTIADISDNIAKSASDFLDLKRAVTVTTNQEKRYLDFHGTYLAKKTIYKKNDHINDILLLNLYIKYLCRYLNGKITQTLAVDSLYNIIEQANKIKDRSTTPQMIELCKDSIHKSAKFNTKILKGASPKHLFLIQKLYRS
ncbi:MAG: nucleotidyl transferase AbiEii/AbiGii toxin family protein [Thaumarchaeota archaeon]|nr:nucleotidyl transferase AbiEii/AbiGii toxin family protein [Nitrososphaerota archaeon]